MSHDFGGDSSYLEKLQANFSRILLTSFGDSRSDAEKEACCKLYAALLMRKRYITSKCFTPGTECLGLAPYLVDFNEGVFMPSMTESVTNEPHFEPPPSFSQFMKDLEFIRHVCILGPTASFSHKRLSILAGTFELHQELNQELEDEQTKDPNNVMDLFSIPKCDNHVHLAGALNASLLLEFIRKKLRDCPNDVVMRKDNRDITLAEMAQMCNVTERDLTLDKLQVHVTNFRKTFKRFDLFNRKFSPLSSTEFRTVFLKTDNYMNGRYFAEITRQLAESMSPDVANEWRLSIYGNDPKEWQRLCDWLHRFSLVKLRGVRWIIQMPRLYAESKRAGKIANFAQYMANFFEPLFEATINPQAHPSSTSPPPRPPRPYLPRLGDSRFKFPSATDHLMPSGLSATPAAFPPPTIRGTTHVHQCLLSLMYVCVCVCVCAPDRFLREVGGFDSVDDESKPEREAHALTMPADPEQWNTDENPPYAYYIGESGSIDHLCSSFLVADHINHGTNLMNSATLQYLFYLAQVGLAMSPCSNNALFVEFPSQPLLKLFKRGLNISLTTDDPMQFHLTNNALIEEYSIAQKMWRFSDVDLAEMAYNSIRMSSFPEAQKTLWHGPNWTARGAASNAHVLSSSCSPSVPSPPLGLWGLPPLLLLRRRCSPSIHADMTKTNVPPIRAAFRSESLLREQALILGRLHEIPLLSRLPPELVQAVIEQCKRPGTDHIAMNLSRSPSLGLAGQAARAAQPPPRPPTLGSSPGQARSRPALGGAPASGSASTGGATPRSPTHPPSPAHLVTGSTLVPLARSPSALAPPRSPPLTARTPGQVPIGSSGSGSGSGSGAVNIPRTTSDPKISSPLSLITTATAMVEQSVQTTPPPLPVLRFVDEIVTEEQPTEDTRSTKTNLFEPRGPMTPPPPPEATEIESQPYPVGWAIPSTPPGPTESPCVLSTVQNPFAPSAVSPSPDPGPFAGAPATATAVAPPPLDQPPPPTIRSPIPSPDRSPHSRGVPIPVPPEAENPGPEPLAVGHPYMFSGSAPFMAASPFMSASPLIKASSCLDGPGLRTRRRAYSVAVPSSAGPGPLARPLAAEGGHHSNPSSPRGASVGASPIAVPLPRGVVASESQDRVPFDTSALDDMTQSVGHVDTWHITHEVNRRLLDVSTQGETGAPIFW
ncbi:putative AMP deaminase [Paratrimastix pyriformis]|uniref:AMP deaminase n=1 Tax=Paratrimastix pyriformis TaxID=342808 RepID=A0ABQ8UMY7_9EUKA|nr:putative AMP deaminase [Paratrimastix pyriformis]